jgi:hypothetical protein
VSGRDDSGAETTASDSRVLLDDPLDLVTLIDDHESFVGFHDVFDLIVFVTGQNSKTVPLLADALVLGQSHQDSSFTAPGLPAFALEIEDLSGSGPTGGLLVERRDPVVHRPHQCLVPSLPLEPLVHNLRILRGGRIWIDTAVVDVK